METNQNKYISVSYKLYSNLPGMEPVMEEEATAEQPFFFITGFGYSLEAFEQKMLELNQGDDFDFTLTPDEGYGPYQEQFVQKLDKSIFSLNGKFDSENIYVDAIVPLQNEAGQRFFGHVIAIDDKEVTMDLNHPLAGKDLNFKGKVLVSRDATAEEISGLLKAMAGGCGGGCGNCGGSCGGNCGDGGCGGSCGGDCGCH